MTFVELNLEAQAVNNAGAFQDTEDIFSGDIGFLSTPSASALRFPFPEGVTWNAGIIITQADLLIRGRLYDALSDYQEDSNSLISILNSATQVLPTTATGVNDATPLTEQVTIGTNAYSSSGYSLDYELGENYATLRIDMLDIFRAAQTDGLFTIDSDKIVILIKPIAHQTFGGIQIDGLSQTSPCYIELTYIPEDINDVDLVVVDSTITEDGTQLIIEFNSPVWGVVALDNALGFTLSATDGSVTVDFVSYETVTSGPFDEIIKHYITFNLSRVIAANETVLLNYEDPPVLYASEVWDTGPNLGLALIPFTNDPVDNNSTIIFAKPQAAQTLSQGNNPRLLIFADLGNVEHGQTLSEGNDPSFITLGIPIPGETKSQGNLPKIRLFSELSDIEHGQTLSQGNQITLNDFFVLSLPEDSQTLSQGNSPRLRVIGLNDRLLIPQKLIPARKWHTF